jgi:hypothetical protein
MYGEPVDPPPNAIVLRQHWQYKIKRNGVRRSRNCCDGSPTAAPLLHKVASTYSSCVEQPVQRLFFALAALLNYNVYGGDATDAFAHSPPPDTPTFVHIDDAYAEWYQARHHVPLDRSKVLPVLHALQGHPESGRLWEHYINAILSSSELVFSTTTHDRCIYTATFDNTKVLLLRQVDDFCLAAPSESFARQIFGIIGRKLQQPNEATPPFEYLGLITDYNGVDVNQTSHYIELTSTGYISRLLRSHGWDTPASKQSANDHVSPLPVDAVHRVYSSALGPPEHTPEHAELEHTQGFSYRTLLGELLFVYITCRPDIGYAVVTLSKFAASPSPLHYQFLKGVAKYLRRTSTWGLRFHRTSPVDSLPPSTPYNLTFDPSLPPFPSCDPFALTGFVDAAHANDLRNCRSTTGWTFLLANACIAYKSKTQTVTATSSTEAEFVAAVSAAKCARYLRSILTELGFAPSAPTTLFEDNASAIQIINARRPTERSRHIDIQYFAIQDWKDSGDIVLRHIPGSINPADALTKPLGWVLHSRHARRLMGHFPTVSSPQTFT